MENRVRELRKERGLKQDELAARLHVNKSNVTRQLTTLEDNGFVLRKRSETDRRSVEVYPTDKAREVEPEIHRVYSEWREQLFSGMSEEERDLLEDVLERLSRRAEEIR